MSNVNENKGNKSNNSENLFKFLFFSAIGILMFFIPITIGCLLYTSPSPRD